MNFWRCKCGERTYLESGLPPKSCQVCEKFGSTLAQKPITHTEPTEHKLKLRYSETTGLPKHYVCTECYTRVPLEKAPVEQT